MGSVQQCIESEASEALFDTLSQNLLIELKLFLYRKIMNEAPFFRDVSAARRAGIPPRKNCSAKAHAVFRKLWSAAQKDTV